MPDLEVEVMLENHPHLFVVEIESVLEAPQVGAPFTCPKCTFKGRIARVGIPGRKARGGSHANDENQSSMLKE